MGWVLALGGSPTARAPEAPTVDSGRFYRTPSGMIRSPLPSQPATPSNINILHGVAHKLPAPPAPRDGGGRSIAPNGGGRQGGWRLPPQDRQNLLSKRDTWGRPKTPRVVARVGGSCHQGSEVGLVTQPHHLPLAGRQPPAPTPGRPTAPPAAALCHGPSPNPFPEPYPGPYPYPSHPQHQKRPAKRLLYLYPYPSLYLFPYPCQHQVTVPKVAQLQGPAPHPKHTRIHTKFINST